MVLIAYPWPVDHWSVRVFWMLVTSYFMFCWTSCFHETAHQTLFSSQRLSVVLGRVLGWLMLVPYTAYRETHFRHHAYLNKPNASGTLALPRPPGPAVVPQGLRLVRSAPGICHRSHRLRPHLFPQRLAPQAEQRRAIRWEYFGMACFWAAILGVVAYYNAWMSFLLVWFIPYSLAGLFQNGRKLTEHLGMKSYDPLRGTRTVIGNNFITKACTFLNFDILRARSAPSPSAGLARSTRRAHREVCRRAGHQSVAPLSDLPDATRDMPYGSSKNPAWA